MGSCAGIVASVSVYFSHPIHFGFPAGVSNSLQPHAWEEIARYFLISPEGEI